jgi:hypothetical protein
MIDPVFVNGFFQFIHVDLGSDCYFLFLELSLTGISLQERRIAKQLLSLDESVLNRLKHDFIEDFLVNLRLLKPPPAVLTESGVMRYRIC